VAAEIYMPQLGLTMTEGTVVRWLKASGDEVKRGEPVVEIETDKVTAEVEAPSDGILGPILVETRAVVPIGGLLSHVLQPGESPQRVPEDASTSLLSETTVQPLEVEPEGAVPDTCGERTIASPRARRIAHELGIDLAQVEASGPGGRIVEADVRWFAEQAKAAPTRISPVARRLAEELEVDLSQVQGTGAAGRITKQDVQRARMSKLSPPLPPAHQPVPPAGPVETLKGVRRVVAERMQDSFTSAPHFYLSAEVEATALTRMREGLLSKVEAASGARLTITDILVKVCAQALAEFPEVNVAWAEGVEGGGILRQSEVNVGVAVALEADLVVPVIHRADHLTLSAIARERADLVKRAQSGKLTSQDLEGGTFTLSNLGMFGVDQFQAIINPPQSAILAVGRIRERPVARDGTVVVHPTMHLTLSIDHRLLNGAQAARFLERLSQLVEEPYLLLG
jgi:pyruvate dehydrogenase E2 component (dihydrolipoamide acetyltransferase)